PEPAGRMRVARARGDADARSLVATCARTLAMTTDAKPRRAARFLGMPRPEAGSVQTVEAHRVECQARRQGRSVDAVARGARALGVARSTQVTRGSRAYAVLAHPIAVVHEVTRRKRVLGLHLDVATIAVPHCPLVFVLMTSEARRHFRA